MQQPANIQQIASIFYSRNYNMFADIDGVIEHIANISSPDSQHLILQVLDLASELNLEKQKINQISRRFADIFFDIICYLDLSILSPNISVNSIYRSVLPLLKNPCMLPKVEETFKILTRHNIRISFPIFSAVCKRNFYFLDLISIMAGYRLLYLDPIKKIAGNPQFPSAYLTSLLKKSFLLDPNLINKENISKIASILLDGKGKSLENILDLFTKLKTEFGYQPNHDCVNLLITLIPELQFTAFKFLLDCCLKVGQIDLNLLSKNNLINIFHIIINQKRHQLSFLIQTFSELKQHLGNPLEINIASLLIYRIVNRDHPIELPPASQDILFEHHDLFSQYCEISAILPAHFQHEAPRIAENILAEEHEEAEPILNPEDQVVYNLSGNLFVPCEVRFDTNMGAPYDLLCYRYSGKAGEFGAPGEHLSRGPNSKPSPRS